MNTLHDLPDMPIDEITEEQYQSQLREITIALNVVLIAEDLKNYLEGETK